LARRVPILKRLRTPDLDTITVFEMDCKSTMSVLVFPLEMGTPMIKVAEMENNQNQSNMEVCFRSWEAIGRKKWDFILHLIYCIIMITFTNVFQIFLLNSQLPVALQRVNSDTVSML